MIWRALAGVAITLMILWIALVFVLWRKARDGTALRNALSLLPSMIRLLKALATDKTLPRRVRVYLWLLFGYLASPLDVVPDFIPLLGYADDVIVVIITLRAVARHAGPDAMRRHWRGSDEGFEAVLALAT